MWISPHEDVIRRLKDELYEARSAIIRLMPEATQNLLRDLFLMRVAGGHISMA